MEYCLFNGKTWEYVDEYTYKNWDKAILGDGTPRYTGKRCIFVGEYDDTRTISEIHGSLNHYDIGCFAKYFGIIKTDMGFGAIQQQPEFIKFVIKGRPYLHETGSGQTWKCHKKAA